MYNLGVIQFRRESFGAVRRTGVSSREKRVRSTENSWSSRSQPCIDRSLRPLLSVTSEDCTKLSEDRNQDWEADARLGFMFRPWWSSAATTVICVPLLTCRCSLIQGARTRPRPRHRQYVVLRRSFPVRVALHHTKTRQFSSHTFQLRVRLAGLVMKPVKHHLQTNRVLALGAK